MAALGAAMLAAGQQLLAGVAACFRQLAAVTSSGL